MTRAGDVGVDGVLLGLRAVGLPEHVAVAVLDADDGVGLDAGAVVGEGEVGAGQVERADLLHAEGDRRHLVELGVDARRVGGVGDGRRADLRRAAARRRC